MSFGRLTKPFPPIFFQKGLLAGGGLNKAIDRTTLGSQLLPAWTLNNVYPISDGFSNYGDLSDSGLGVRGIINNPEEGKVQGIGEFQGFYIYAKNGKLFRVAKGGGNETVLSGVIFQPNARVRFCTGRGRVGEEKYELLYIVDNSGAKNPYYYDGTSVTELTVFDGLIQYNDFGKPVGMISWLDRIVWFFHKSSDFKNAILASTLDDGNDYENTGGEDQSFFVEVFAGDNTDYITGLAVAKKSGSDTDTQELVVYKTKTSAISSQRAIPFTSSAITVFSVLSDVGAVNHEAIVNFDNSIYSMSAMGIGAFESGTTSGGIYSKSFQSGIRVNPLITKGSKNQLFENAFCLHCVERQMILFTFPESNQTVSDYEGYPYPEIPMNQTICYRYGVQDNSGDVVDVWSTFKGKGWGWSCGFVDGKRVLWGDYLTGQIFEWFVGAEWQRNPLEPDKVVPIESTYETGDMILESSSNDIKQVQLLVVNWFILSKVDSVVCLYYDCKESGICYEAKGNATKEYGIWGVSKWGRCKWGGKASNITSYLYPSDRGRYVRIKISWKNIDERGRRAFACLQNFSGRVSYGGAILRSF